MAERDELLEIERAAVRGWPALERAEIDGWLARSSSGGSVRANTVSALDYSGADLDRSLAMVEAFYRARNAAPRFTITDVTAPAGLDAILQRRGWRRDGDHVTMAREVGAMPAVPHITVVAHTVPTPAWLGVYLEGLTSSRRDVAPRLVERVPEPRCFFSGLRDGVAVASGLSVLDGRLASVQCMATLPTARRTGAARAVLAAIEAWARGLGARRLYLQTDLANTAAMTLYGSIGFIVVGRYHTRELPE